MAEAQGGVAGDAAPTMSDLRHPVGRYLVWRASSVGVTPIFCSSLDLNYRPMTALFTEVISAIRLA